MSRKFLFGVLSTLIVAGCSTPAPANRPAPGPLRASYFDNTGRDDALSGGVKMIPVATPKGTFKVWTKRVGNNPKIKVLLLHGGPGVTHEVYEVFDSHFPGAGFGFLAGPVRALLCS